MHSRKDWKGLPALGFGLTRTGVTAALLACLGLLVAGPPASSQPVVPPQFEDRVVATGFGAPTAMAWVPDGRLLIASKTAGIYVYSNGADSTRAVNLHSVLCYDWERGVTGVAVDPQFALNHYVYVYYTFKKHGVCDTGTANSPVNRVSRFVLRDDGVITPASEVVLLDNIPSPSGVHNAGTLEFGNDGYLYVTVGDGGCDYAGDSGCQAQNDAARDRQVLLGKVLRITRDGDIPPTNPYVGPDSGRCNLAGRTAASVCQETFAWGLRNPFKLAFDPNAENNRFFINDVGGGGWEEIDLGQVGADYGWNVREGPCAVGAPTSCGPPPAGMTNPIYAYHHDSGCTAVTAAAFTPLGLWPREFDASYLFGDFVCGKLFRAVPSPGGGLVVNEFATGLGANGIVAANFGPHGSGQALYWLHYSAHELHRIAYTGAANRAPVANADADPEWGPLPLSVTFDASTSNDPDGDPLTYEWDFGDGSSGEGVTATHTYAQAGTYSATLTVRDDRSGVDDVEVRIDAGNEPPQPSIGSPTKASRFSVGGTILLRGLATDPEDGSLPSESLTWR